MQGCKYLCFQMLVSFDGLQMFCESGYYCVWSADFVRSIRFISVSLPPSFVSSAYSFIIDKLYF